MSTIAPSKESCARIAVATCAAVAELDALVICMAAETTLTVAVDPPLREEVVKGVVRLPALHGAEPWAGARERLPQRGNPFSAPLEVVGIAVALDPAYAAKRSLQSYEHIGSLADLALLAG